MFEQESAHYSHYFGRGSNFVDGGNHVDTIRLMESYIRERIGISCPFFICSV